VGGSLSRRRALALTSALSPRRGGAAAAFDGMSILVRVLRPICSLDLGIWILIRVCDLAVVRLTQEKLKAHYELQIPAGRFICRSRSCPHSGLQGEDDNREVDGDDEGYGEVRDGLCEGWREEDRRHGGEGLRQDQGRREEHRRESRRRRQHRGG
jgi:hypothetical protein